MKAGYQAGVKIEVLIVMNESTITVFVSYNNLP